MQDAKIELLVGLDYPGPVGGELISLTPRIISIHLPWAVFYITSFNARISTALGITQSQGCHGKLAGNHVTFAKNSLFMIKGQSASMWGESHYNNSTQHYTDCMSSCC